VEVNKKIESMEEQEGGKETLIKHLSVKEVGKEAGKISNTVCNILENKSREDFDMVEEILINDLVFRKVSTTNPGVLNDTTEIDNHVLDNILDNIKGLEDENLLLRDKLEFEKERYKIENEEKMYIHYKMLEQKKQIENIKSHFCFKVSEDIEKVKNSADSIKNEGFYGFEQRDVYKALVNKAVLDKAVIEEECFVNNFESVLKQTKRRNLLEKLIHEEENILTKNLLAKL